MLLMCENAPTGMVFKMVCQIFGNKRDFKRFGMQPLLSLGTNVHVYTLYIIM